MSGRAVVRAGVDTWANPNKPNANYASAVNSWVGGPSGAPAYTYLYFKNPAPRQATIQSATLRVYGKGAWGAGARTMHAARIGKAVKFSKLTWANRPGTTGGSADLTQVNNADGTLWEFNVTAQLQTIANGAANYGFRLACDDSTMQRLYTLDSSYHQPSLEVVWSDKPQAPTSLVPSGNQYVSVSKPTLSWDYIDIGGNTELAAIQVQMDQGANWSAPAWDSGVVATQDSQLDLSTTSWGGLNDGGYTYWRVRVQDGSGLWSQWSSRSNGVGARFRRKVKGTLTLLSPGPPPNNYVEDVSPPIIWQLTGATQQSWRVVIADPDDPSEWLYNSGRTNGTDTAFTLPRPRDGGPLDDWGGSYLAIVDVWDTYDRVGTPGDTAYYRVRQQFTLHNDATVDPVGNLTGSNDPDGRPYLHLRWDRATAPDSFTVFRDNKVVDSDLLPQDLITDPNSYEYKDKDATQNTQHDWSVQCVVNGKNSIKKTWTGEIDSVHAWLVDWDTDRIVAIQDPDIQFEMPDSSATYEPIMRDRVIRVTAKQRGMEGTVAGRMVQWDFTSLDTWEDNLVWMKSRPNQWVRLMVGNKTWRVLLGDVVIAPMRIPDDQALAVSFSFWSIDGPPEP